MSALPNNQAGIETGVFLPSGPAAWEEIARRFAVVRDRKTNYREALVALGLALLEMQKRSPHGTFGRLLLNHGIHVNTSRASMRAAQEHLGLIERRKAQAKPDAHDGTDPVCTGPEQFRTMVRNNSGSTEQTARTAQTPGEFREMLIESGYAPEVVDSVMAEQARADQARAAMAAAAAPDDGLDELEEDMLEADEPVVRSVSQAGSQSDGVIRRIGPAVIESGLAQARRPDVEGQMTLVPAFVAVGSRMALARERGGEVCRKAEAAAVRFAAELDAILGEAA